jgi:hypothetical protein
MELKPMINSIPMPGPEGPGNSGPGKKEPGRFIVCKHEQQ